MMFNKPLVFVLLAVLLFTVAIWTSKRQAENTGGATATQTEPKRPPDTDPFTNPTTPR